MLCYKGGFLVMVMVSMKFSNQVNNRLNSLISGYWTC